MYKVTQLADYLFTKHEHKNRLGTLLQNYVDSMHTSADLIRRIDIRDVCQSAQLSSVTEMFNSVGYREPTENEEPQTPRALTLADFRTILARRRPSVSVEMLRAFTKWTDQFGAL